MEYGVDARLDAWPDRLSGCRLKIRRAKDHLDQLDWHAGNWAGLFTEMPQTYDPQTGFYTVEVAAREPTDVDDFGVLVGDYVHNARSALDHLVWAVVDARGIDPPGGHSGFLLRDTPSEFNRDSVNRTSNRGRLVMSPLHGMTADDVDRVRAVQPFSPLENAVGRSPDHARPWINAGHPLVALSLLDNYDKHRVVHATALDCIHYRNPDQGLPSIAYLSTNDDCGEIIEPQWIDTRLSLGDRGVVFTARLRGAGPSPAILPSGLGLRPLWSEWFFGLDHFASMYEVVVRVVDSFAVSLR